MTDPAFCWNFGGQRKPERIENVPEEYRQVGTSILMENDAGQTRSFLVTRLDDETLTVDGNNPTVVTADGSRPDVGAAFPAAGPNHGFNPVVNLVCHRGAKPR